VGGIWIFCWFFLVLILLVFFGADPLLYIYNTLIILNFDVLKYIKKIFKISTQYIFNVQQRTAQKNQ